MSRESQRVLCLAVLAMACVSSLLSCSKKSTRSCGGEDLIAFLSNRAAPGFMVWTMKSDGTQQNRVEGAWSSPAFGQSPLLSPDRKEIVFTQAHESQGWAMIANSDGSGLDTLVKEKFLSFVYLGDWSPDGSKLAYFVISYTDTSESGVYVVNADGSGKLRLVQGYNPRFCGSDKVVYDDRYGIYVIGTNGEGQRRLQEKPWATDMHKPTGSPDGSKVAWYRAHGPAPPYLKCWLELIDPDSSGYTRLVEIKGVYSFAEIEFSPDSKRILFLTQSGPAGEIYVVNTDGSGLRPLTSNNAIASGGAHWSPDGSRIVFTWTKDGNREIYTVNTSGPPLMRRLTNNLADDCNPDW